MTQDDSDPGLAAVDLLYKYLMVDDEWAVRTERGFTWWAYRLAQHVEADPPKAGPDGAASSRIRIWTDVATGVPDRDAKAPEVLNVVNMTETMSALVWDSKTATLSETCTSVVFADTVESWVKVLTTAAVLQNCAAHSRAHGVAEALDGHVAASNHPTSGERPEMDDILNVPQQMAANGAGPSKFTGELIERLAAPDSPVSTMSSLSNGSTTEFTAEFPFSAPEPAAGLVGTNTPVQTSLLQIFTDQPNPQLGSGALIVLKLPIHLEADDRDGPASYANALNFLEGTTDTGTTMLGAWCVDPTNPSGIAFVSFVPSEIAKGGILENLCIYNAVRSSWAYTVFDQ